MPKKRVITAIDLGTEKCVTIIAVVDEETGELKVVGVSVVPAKGMKRSVIVDLDQVLATMSQSLDAAERMAGFDVRSVYLAVSGTHITSKNSKGVVAVAAPDQEITASDVERVIEAARTVSTPPNYEILHVIPKSFTVDGQAGIKDPMGMNGVRLEVDTQIIQGLSSQVKNLTKAVYRPGINIEDLVFSILATAEAVLTSRQKELGVVVINIGGATTSLVVFEEGDILHTAVLPVGSDHITSDIAIGLRISIDTAEKIKLEYGQASATKISKRDEIDLAEFEGEGGETISRKYVAEIIEARVEEIFDKVENELKKIDRSGKLPAGVVLTGGGAKLPELVDLAKKRLRLPASLGSAVNLTSVLDKAKDPAFATAIGLVLWGNQLADQRSGGSLGRFFSKITNLNSISSQAKKWWRKIIP